MSLNNIAKNSGTVLLLSFTATVIGYLLRLFLARNLSLSEYGLFYAVLVFVGFFATFRDPGLGTALAKFIPEFMVKKQLGRVKASIFFVSIVQILLGLIIVVPIFLFSDWIAINYFGTATAALPIKLISLSFLISIVMSLLQTIFQGLEKMFYFAAVEPLRLSIVFIISFLLISTGLAGPAYGYLIAPIIVSVILFAVLLRASPLLRAKAEIDKALIRKLFFFGLPLFIGGLGSVLISYMDTIILTLFRSLDEVGLYQAALPTSQLLWFFIGGIGSVLLPTVSGLWSDGRKEDVSNGILILTKILFMIIVPLAILFVAFPEIILRILFGETFVAASQSLQILAIGSIFYTFYFMFGLILIAIGKSTTYTKLLFSVGGIGMILNIILTPIFGITGAALSTSISYTVGLILAIVYAKKFVAIKFPLSGMVKALLGGIIVLILISAVKASLDLDPLSEIFIAGIASVVMYTTFALRFIINKGDLKILSAIGIRLPVSLSKRLEKTLK
ncbi:MAG: flippase [Candidatus Aenigmarchaeota archaeon]|nr:flippase [Candidatus Aenigmarchaeota archaeon]